MKPLPRYWARREDRVTVPLEAGPEVWDLITYGSSSDSQADAQRQADERFAAFMAAGGDVHRDWYYPLRHAPEEILREIHDGEDLIGVITRNRYGVEVLNTDALLIADIDVPEPAPDRRARGRETGASSGGGSLLGRLFGRRRTDPGPDLSGTSASTETASAPAAPEDPTALAMIEHIAQVARSHSDLGFSTYRTRAGLRVLVTGLGASPSSTEARALLEEMRSDPLYVALCRVQETFRARLTPKPWRVGSYALHQAFHGPNIPAQPPPVAWLEEYASLSAGYAVCRLIDRTGPMPTSREQMLIDLHDQAVGIERAGSLPLA